MRSTSPQVGPTGDPDPDAGGASASLPDGMVTASGRADLRCGIVPEMAQASWDDWATGSPSGHLHQTFWWAMPLRQYGLTPDVVAAWAEGDRLLGGTLFRCTRVPRLPVQIAESLDGPAFEQWNSAYAAPYALAVADFARRSRALAVIIRDCPNAEIHRDLTDALRLQAGDVVLSRGVTEAVLHLDGQTTDALWSGFSHGVRSSIKRGRVNAVQIKRLEDPEGLRAAHDTWLATARRKGFESVRPWPALEPVLRCSVASGAGLVFGAIVDGRVIASIFVTYLGRTAVYVYGGHLDGAERYSAAHLLQLSAIEEAMARGLPTYSFGGLPAHGDREKSGIDQFKLSFGAVPRQALDTITWRRHVVLYETLTRFRAHPVGVRIERALRRRVAAHPSSG